MPSSSICSALVVANKWAAGDDAGPAGLMAGAEAGAVVAMKIFVEEKVIAPVGIVLKRLSPAKDGTVALLHCEKMLVKFDA